LFCVCVQRMWGPRAVALDRNDATVPIGRVASNDPVRAPSECTCMWSSCTSYPGLIVLKGGRSNSRISYESTNCCAWSFLKVGVGGQCKHWAGIYAPSTEGHPAAAVYSHLIVRRDVFFGVRQQNSCDSGHLEAGGHSWGGSVFRTQQKKIGH
jgi:hypothetical protein